MYIAMYGQTVRAEVIVPSGTSMGKQGTCDIFVREASTGKSTSNALPFNTSGRQRGAAETGAVSDLRKTQRVPGKRRGEVPVAGAVAVHFPTH